MTSEIDFTRGLHTRPSRLYLPKLESPPATILEYLLAHFPQVHPRTWCARVARGLVSLSDGTTLRKDSPYRHGLTVFYRKKVPSEPDPLEEPLVIYRDEEILVADKPHGMPVTPAGEYVERSLLVRLQKRTGMKTLAPAHRLDRDTAGIVLFVVNPAVRAHYHRLFSEEMIQREYLAIAHVAADFEQTEWTVCNRIERGAPWYTQAIFDGPANAT